MTEIVCLICTELLILWCFMVRPVRWTAAPGWYVNGIRPNGRFEARPVLGDGARDLEDARDRRDIADERAIVGRIYCTGGARPIVVDYRTVGCQR